MSSILSVNCYVWTNKYVHQKSGYHNLDNVFLSIEPDIFKCSKLSFHLYFFATNIFLPLTLLKNHIGMTDKSLPVIKPNQTFTNTLLQNCLLNKPTRNVNPSIHISDIIDIDTVAKIEFLNCLSTENTLTEFPPVSGEGLVEISLIFFLPTQNHGLGAESFLILPEVVCPVNYIYLQLTNAKYTFLYCLYQFTTKFFDSTRCSGSIKTTGE